MTSGKKASLYLTLGSALWFGLFIKLYPLARFVTSLIPVEPESHLGAALAFFVYDAPKVLLLLSAVVFVMGIINNISIKEIFRCKLLESIRAANTNIN